MKYVKLTDRNASGRTIGGSNLWDQLLPKDVFAIGSIDEGLGDVAVEQAYGELSPGRESWQISWMEHDSSMTQPQVWVERILGTHFSVFHPQIPLVFWGVC